MGYNFPNNPNVGDIISFPSGTQQYIWDGTSWNGAPFGQQFITGSGSNISSSYSVTASYSLTASYVSGSMGDSVSSSYALSASHLIGYSQPTLIAGPGISVDGYKISASVLTVNGSFPDANGNITTALTNVITGTSGSLILSASGDITSSLTVGDVWVISGDLDPSQNGVSYIYSFDGTVGSWLKLSSLDQVAADNRYLMLTPQSPLAGPLSAPFGVTGSLLGTATNAISASRAQTSSVSLFAVTASYALTVAPKSGFLWSGPMGNPSIVGAVMGGTATYLNPNVGVRITQNTGGQYGYINFNAVGFDFNKDFRISIATYAGVVSGGTTTGDGIWIGFGGSSGIDRQANSQNAFSWWSSTYSGNPGQWIYFNGAVVANEASETSATGQWVANTIEARRNTVGSRTLSVFTNGTYRLSYTGNQTLAGSWITIGASTGAAWADHYVRYICFEYI